MKYTELKEQGFTDEAANALADWDDVSYADYIAYGLSIAALVYLVAAVIGVL